MPALDRFITIRIQDPQQRDDYGDALPITFTDYEVWAQSSGAGSSDVLTTGGIRTYANVSWTTRFFIELYEVSPDVVSITDEYGNPWNVDFISEIGRRRFLQIAAVRAT